MKRPTIKDVAAIAGVSTASVSHVLNGTKTVSEDIKVRVRAAVRELHYRPSGVATSLRRRSSGVIGLVLPMQGHDTSAAFFTQLAEGVEDEVSKHGYRTIISNSDEDTEREQAHLQVLRGHFVDFIDALVIAPTVSSGESLLTSPVSDGIPLAYVDRIPEGMAAEADYVGTNNYEVSAAGLRKMVAKGCKDIVCISSPIDVSSMVARKRAFDDVCASGMDRLSDRIVVSESSYKAGIEAARRAFDDFPDTDGLFVTNNSVAMGVVRVLTERHHRGLSVPQLLLYDYYDWMELVPFAFTAIRQPAFEMGSETGRLLVRRLSNPGAPAQNTIINSTLIERSSIEQRSER